MNSIAYTSSLHDITILDFWAEWCNPCKILHPILDEISKENPDVYVLDVDIEKFPELSSELEIQSVPTVMIFKKGKLLDSVSGTMANKTKIVSMIEAARIK